MSCILATALFACGNHDSKPDPKPSPPSAPSSPSPAPDNEYCGAPEGHLVVEDVDDDGWSDGKPYDGKEQPLQDSCGDPCGPNSPVTNTFPINGLKSDGKCDPEGVRLVPGSLISDKCGSGATLEMRGNKLVGTRAGSVVCAGSNLTNAQFKVRSYVPHEATYTITKVDDSLLVQGTTSDYLENYTIVGAAGTSLCGSAAAAQAREDLGLKQLPPEPTLGTGAPNEQSNPAVIAVPGPLYNTKLRIYAHTEQFFHLACVDDAIGKRSVDGFYGTDEKKNTAAIRMFTATYCKKPYTVRGIIVDFGKGSGALEAEWGDKRAGCLESSRLMAYLKAKNLTMKALGNDLLPEYCQQHSCTPEKWEWAVRDECKGTKIAASCQGISGLFETRVVTDQNPNPTDVSVGAGGEGIGSGRR
ncbi:MAG TPA: ADYC domain-containing protein [Kofleriaceae bacterium]|jgi:hypothetical protein